MGIAAPTLWAAVNDLIVQFTSQPDPNTGLQTLPREQGWIHTGFCLTDGCPGPYNPAPDPISYPCYYQGWRDIDGQPGSDNSCLPGIGCNRLVEQLYKPVEQYNSPEPSILDGTCTYTEWIAFDGGINEAYHQLTIPDSTVAGSPPWGAPNFQRGPSHPVLRIVTGDGNSDPGSNSLPVSGLPNNRNRGRAWIHYPFTVPNGATSLTLICTAAAGPRGRSQEFVRVRVFGQRFAFGVDGDSSSPSYGRFTYGDAGSGDGNGQYVDLMSNRTVAVAQPNATGPASGEFFTLRAILNADGSFVAYFNEDGDSHVNGQVTADSPPGVSEISLTPEDGDATMWIDSVELREGAVAPGCPHLLFDINRDKKIDQTDIVAFFGCATGPANATGTWATLNSSCRCMDVNQDQSIDMLDYAVLQRCITTGATTANPDPSCGGGGS